MHRACGYFKEIVKTTSYSRCHTNLLFSASKHLYCTFWQNLEVKLSACPSVMRSVEGQSKVSRVSRPTDSSHKEVIALFWIKWPSGTDRITGRLHKEGCTWGSLWASSPSLLTSATENQPPSSARQPRISDCDTQRAHTRARTHRGVLYRAGETPGCVCLFLVRRWDPVAGWQIWNGTWSSI